MGLRNALSALNNAVDDLTSLHVQTFTGNIAFDHDTQNYDDIRQLIQQAQTNADVVLVAESLYKFDGDSYNFLANAESGIPASALELHKAAIEGGIKTRQGLMELVKDVFDS